MDIVVQDKEDYLVTQSGLCMSHTSTNRKLNINKFLTFLFFYEVISNSKDSWITEGFFRFCMNILLLTPSSKLETRDVLTGDLLFAPSSMLENLAVLTGIGEVATLTFSPDPDPEMEDKLNFLRMTLTTLSLRFLGVGEFCVS